MAKISRLTTLMEPQHRSGRALIVGVLGFTQCLAWGSTYYLLAVLDKPIAMDTGWSLTTVVAGLSLGLMIAGLASPFVGRAIERRGGRPVLVGGSAIMVLGLVALGLAQGPIGYFAAWAVLGFGMAAGLYDPAFAMLGRLYGRDARRLITNLTLIGGFASTLAWPLSAFLVETLGWRGACFSYAAMHLVLGLPLHFLLLPRESVTAPDVEPLLARSAAHADVTSDALTKTKDSPQGRQYLILVWMLGANFTIQAVISSVMSVHLITIVQRLGLPLAGAVALGTLVGPSQVGGRLLEVAFGRRFHPVWTAVAASFFVLAGLSVLVFGNPAVIAAGLLLYGAGNGIKTIVKGTLPLSLFGGSGYASLLGRLAMPSLVAQAIAPALIAIALQESGVAVSLGILAGLAAANLLLSYALRLVSPSVAFSRR